MSLSASTSKFLRTLSKEEIISSIQIEPNSTGSEAREIVSLDPTRVDRDISHTEEIRSVTFLPVSEFEEIISSRQIEPNSAGSEARADRDISASECEEITRQLGNFDLFHPMQIDYEKSIGNTTSYSMPKRKPHYLLAKYMCDSLKQDKEVKTNNRLDSEQVT